MKKELTKYLLIPLILVSFYVNYYYGSKGVLAVDTFSHFDSAYKLLKGVIIFRDFWNISGGVIDYLQLPFFYFFGTNWSSYILQSSIFNSCLTVTTYYFLKNIELDNIKSFFYSICFAILANPSMGTPFVDHYSTFFSLLSFYSFILAIKSNSKLYWFLLPILLFLAFFSKQTPAAYVILSIFLAKIIYIFIYKKFSFIKPLLSGISICLIFLTSFLILNEIQISEFITQYFLFPQTIGSSRISNFKLDLNNTILNFKFIHIFLILLIYALYKKRNVEIEENKFKFILNFTLFIFSFSLIFHQIYTKNFIFIFFLIPLIGGVLHNQFNFFKYKKIFINFLILITLFSTFKYHQRFNIDRKMLNLENIDLDKAIDASKINKKLAGLKWVTYGPLTPSEEIKLIKDSLKIIDNDKNEILLLTHYNFFSSVLEKTLYSPSRWPTDLVSNPSKNNKYYNYYIIFTKNLILKRKIKSIYITIPSYQDIVLDVFDSECIKKAKLNKILIHYEINDDCTRFSQ